jgi:hypothetical protein
MLTPATTAQTQSHHRLGSRIVVEICGTVTSPNQWFERQCERQGARHAFNGTRTFEISGCDIDAEGAVFYKIVEPSTGRARVEQVYSPRRGSVLRLARLSNACGIDAPTRWDELVGISFNDAETGFHFDMMGLRVVEHLPETTKGARKGDLFGEDQSDERAVQMQFAGRLEPRERPTV